MTDRAYFQPALFEFLRALKRHNNRDWFARNKERYLSEVQEPALAFIGEFAAPLHKISGHFVADPRPARGSLFRIYRDIRFSSDKRPYKTHVGMQFTHSTGKDAHAPCFYLHLEPENCFAAGGVWHPDARALTQLRAAIVRDTRQWAKVRRSIELDGESLSRPPRGYPADHPFIDDLKHKDFVASVPLSEKQICSPKFMRDFVAACRTMEPLVEFTTKALGLKF